MQLHNLSVRIVPFEKMQENAIFLAGQKCHWIRVLIGTKISLCGGGVLIAKHHQSDIKLTA